MDTLYYHWYICNTHTYSKSITAESKEPCSGGWQHTVRQLVTFTPSKHCNLRPLSRQKKDIVYYYLQREIWGRRIGPGKIKNSQTKQCASYLERERAFWKKVVVIDISTYGMDSNWDCCPPIPNILSISISGKLCTELRLQIRQNVAFISYLLSTKFGHCRKSIIYDFRIPISVFDYPS